MSKAFDVVVLGSGFGGSLLCAALAQHGLRVASVDTASHPRFAIGESSTPLADSLLEQFALRWRLPQLLPLTRYGTWKRHYPDVTCGLKRGFSYFEHRPGADRRPCGQMLVAASADDETADTHWLRSDVDQLIFQLAAACGTTQLENAAYELSFHASQWHLTGTARKTRFALTAPLIIDATGSAGVVPRLLGIPDQTFRLRTKSHAVFGHFRLVSEYSSLLDADERDLHPFPADAAALHHVLQDGWMWQLRFEDQTVSCGIVGNWSAKTSAAHVWKSVLSEYPRLSLQLSGAKCVRPACGLVKTKRLQRLFATAAGDTWAALPATTGFVDPLHSTGIAHTLHSVCRLADIIAYSESRSADLREYGRRIVDQILHIDDLVHGCYAAQPSFELWCDWCMLYFAAVTSVEQSESPSQISFLRSDDAEFRSLIAAARRRLQQTVQERGSKKRLSEFRTWLADAIAPWNQVGLLDPAVGGMYSSTAAPRHPLPDT